MTRKENSGTLGYLHSIKGAERSQSCQMETGKVSNLCTHQFCQDFFVLIVLIVGPTGFPGGPSGKKNPPANAGDIRDTI